MGEPGEEVGYVVFEVLFPNAAPLVAAVFGIRGHGVHADHGGTVGTNVVITAPASTPIVAVIGIAVICEIDGDNGGEVGGMVCGDLDAGEPTVGGTGHGDFSGAPGLFGNPGDGFYAVLLFAGSVLIGVDAFAAAASPAVQAGADEAVFGKLVVLPGIRRYVVFAVGDVFQDEWVGRVLPVFSVGNVDVHGEVDAV